METRLGTNLALNVVYLSEMKRLGEKCASAGIKLVALRGGALLADDFDSSAGRHMRDLDLLVAPHDETAVIKMLAKEKWEPIPGGERCFRKIDPPRYIDLHNGLRGVPRNSLSRFLNRTRPVSGIKGIHALADADAVLVNAYHSVVDHGHMDEKWLADAAGMIRRAGRSFDWDALAVRGRETGWTAALRLFLETVSEEEGVEIPAAACRVSGFEKLRYRISRRLVKNSQPSVIRGHLMRLLFSRGPVEAIFSFGRLLFPGFSFIRRRYGLSSWSGVLKHVLLRPVLVLWKTSRMAAHSLDRRRSTV